MRLLYRSGVAAHSRLLWIASSSMHGRASGKAYSSCDQTVTPGPSDLTKQPRAQLQYSESSKMIMPQGLASPATNNAEQLQQIEVLKLLHDCLTVVCQDQPNMLEDLSIFLHQ
ncbi:TPA: hypothetical protein ACH3X2_007024 [Trebouxia sp. C0005]